MILPIFLPSYQPVRYIDRTPRVDTSRIERGIDSVGNSIKELASKIEKGTISVTANTEDLIAVIRPVAAWVKAESDRYSAAYSEARSRISRIDEWKSARKKKKKEREIELREAWFFALKENCEFDYKNQPKPRWWKGEVEKSLDEFKKEAGISNWKAVEDRMRFERMVDKESEYMIGMWDLEYRWHDSRCNSIAKKHKSHDKFNDILKLNDICNTIRGATLQIPMDTMQAVAQIAAELQVNLQLDGDMV